MKITQVNNERPAWLDSTFQLEMNGEELLRLFTLSWHSEGGPQHRVGKERFWCVIEGLLPGMVWREENKRLSCGKYV